MSCFKPRQNAMGAVFHGNVVALTLQTTCSQMKNGVIGIEAMLLEAVFSSSYHLLFYTKEKVGVRNVNCAPHNGSLSKS